MSMFLARMRGSSHGRPDVFLIFSRGILSKVVLYVFRILGKNHTSQSL